MNENRRIDGMQNVCAYVNTLIYGLVYFLKSCEFCD